TGVGKIVKPDLELPRVDRNREGHGLWHQHRYDASGADAIEQAAVQEFAAGMKPGKSFDVPDLGAAPILPTARQSLGSKLDRDGVAARDLAFVLLLPVR